MGNDVTSGDQTGRRNKVACRGAVGLPHIMASPPWTDDEIQMLHELEAQRKDLDQQKPEVQELMRVQELSGELASSNRRESVRYKQHLRLSEHLMAIREEERKNIAREIHDDLGQMLASLQLNVSLMAMEHRDNEKIAASTALMEQLISSSILTVQRISSELRPVMLDLLGLAEAMEWQAQEFQKKSGILCKVIILLAEKNVDRDVSTAIYRIFQESLTNVIRHSGATRVQAYLVEKKGYLTLSVCDNGRGIVESEKNNLQTFGIVGMRERAEALSGKLRICGSSRNGTALFARIPSSKKEDRHAHQDNNSR
jgi:signal transduction histidine kinase